MDVKDFLIRLSNTPRVSGSEAEAITLVSREFEKYAVVTTDRFGNLIARKPGTGSLKVMVSAHLDETGLMVTGIEKNGFVKFTRIGGVDSRILVAQEVVIHGQEDVFGVIGIKPPHLTKPEEARKAVETDTLAVDTGYTDEELKKRIRIGDRITINRKCAELQNNRLAGRAMDNAAGVATLLCAMRNLEHYSHAADLYFVATTQEELGLRGAVTASHTIGPDIGIAIDAGFGRAPGLSEHETIEIGKGPGIGVGPNIHRVIYERFKDIAAENHIPYQVDVQPKMSGTEAMAIQVSESGPATGLLSIPVRYMHTPVETVAMEDIENCGKLLSEFIVRLNRLPDAEWSCVEELICC